MAREHACSPKDWREAVHLAFGCGDAVTISPAQMSYLLYGIDWRNPQETRRPTRIAVLGLNLLLHLIYWLMISKPDDLPSDLVSALAALQAEREARLRAEAMAASAQAELSDDAALIAHLELRIEKLKRELYGQRSERTSRLIEQLELELEELVTTASEDELAAQAAAAKALEVRAFTRKRPVRKPWPDDIEHERVIIEAPTTCACCGGSRLARIGEDVTKTLEEIPRRFKVV